MVSKCYQKHKETQKLKMRKIKGEKKSKIDRKIFP